MTTESVARSALQVMPGARDQGTNRSAAARFQGVLPRLRMPSMLLSVDCVAMAVSLAVVRPAVVAACGLTLLTLVLYANGRLYRSRLAPSVLDQLPRLVGRALTAGACVVAVAPVVDDTLTAEVLRASAVFAVLVVVGRVTAYTVVGRLRRVGTVAHRTLILGGGQVARQVAETLIGHPEYGLRPVGFVDDDPLNTGDELAVPLLGRNLDLPQVIEEHQTRTVVVAFGSAPESTLVDVLRACDRLSCEIFFVPRLYELQAVSDDMETVWGIPLVRWRRAAFRTVSWRAKRAVDVLVSVAALILLTPVFLVLSLLVRLETGPGVIFRQERVGLDGRAFTLLKFRSLRPAAETEDARLWSLAEDDRVGPIGRVLRRTSLDELPQLWNVLRGDMSLVGPRPERPFFVAEFAQRFPRYMARHRVPAGVTGWSQVHGLRGDTSIAERARFDNCYIENWSLWQDVKIMLRTAGQVVRCAGR